MRVIRITLFIFFTQNTAWIELLRRPEHRVVVGHFAEDRGDVVYSLVVESR